MSKNCSRCGARLSLRNSFIWNSLPVCSSCLQHFEFFNDDKNIIKFSKNVEILNNFAQLSNLADEKIMLKVICSNCGKKYKVANPNTDKIYRCNDCGNKVYVYHLYKDEIFKILKLQYNVKNSQDDIQSVNNELPLNVNNTSIKSDESSNNKSKNLIITYILGFMINLILYLLTNQTRLGSSIVYNLFKTTTTIVLVNLISIIPAYLIYLGFILLKQIKLNTKTLLIIIQISTLIFILLAASYH